MAGGAGGDITITGGEVIAKGGNYGAGVGGGGYRGGKGGDGGTIEISGGTVTATGGGDGAGIGGGSGSAGGTITINKGTVTANGGEDGAGIGGGTYGDGGTIGINDGEVTANGGYGSAGIGGGNQGAGGTITINKGTVTAKGGDGGAGIGGGAYGKGGTITITDGEVIATGGVADGAGKVVGGAGIGGGASGAGGEITITGGEVIAKGGNYGAGVGGGGDNGGDSGGKGGDGGTIEISGGTVEATGGYGSAGIGGGSGGGSGGTITISNGTVTATGGGDGAGVGGGSGGTGGKITISGGEVTATGGQYGAGVGGGSRGGDGGTIEISSGTVTANGGQDGAGIGGGSGGAGGEITIDGNAVVFAIGALNHIGAGVAGAAGTVARTRGVIFEGASGKVYGSSVTLAANTTIPSGKTLTLEAGHSLLIPANITLTNNGTLSGTGFVSLLRSSAGVNGSGTGNDTHVKRVLAEDTTTIANTSYGTPPAVTWDGVALVTNTDYTVGEMAVGTSVPVTITGAGGYHGSVTKSIEVAKINTEIASLAAYNGNTPTNSFAYGDTITLTFTPQVKARAALGANQAAIFLGDVQLSEPVDITLGRAAQLHYNTAQQGLPLGDATLTVKFGGNGSYDTSSGSVRITLNKKAVTAQAGAISKEYDGTNALKAADRILTIAKVSADDDITVTMPNATYNNAAVGANKPIDIGEVVITGAAKDWYAVTVPSGLTGDILKKSGSNASDDGDSTDGWLGGLFAPAPSILDAAAGGKSAAIAVGEAIKKAVAAGNKGKVSARATFGNYDSLALQALKAINDAAAKEAAGKNLPIDFKVNFDKVEKGAVLSRITVDPAALAKALADWKQTDKLPLGVSFDQKDAKVKAFNELFKKHFDNKIVSVVFEQKTPLGVTAEFCAKLNLEQIFGKGKTLYFYSYNPTTNLYTRIEAPNYWVDESGYAHITAPLGGYIVIADKPLGEK